MNRADRPGRDIDCPPRLRAVLTALVTRCDREEDVLAAWLGGSIARGVADDWSDIDLHVLVRDRDGFAAAVPEWIGRAITLVMVDAIPGVPGGFIAITPDWVHMDVVVHGTAGFVQGDLPANVLVERSGLVRDVSPGEEAVGDGPYLPDSPATMFLYFMGNLATVVHRGEWIALMQGTAMMRDGLLIPLMLAENGVRKRDGPKRLNHHLTDEQREALDAIPPIGTDPEQLLAAQVAVAREYLRRGRRLAARLGAPRPDALEQAARDLWARELNLAID